MNKDFEKYVDNPFTFIGVVVSIGIIAFSLGLLVGMLY